MKVVQINSVAYTGSTGRIAGDIGDVLIEKGHKSYIAYGRGEAVGISELIKIGDTLGTYLHGLNTLLTDGHGFSSKNATSRLVNQLDQIKPDLIGLHNLHGYYLNVNVLFEWINKNSIPLVWTLHDCWPITGHCTYFDSVNCEKWIAGCYSCPKLNAYPKSLVDGSKRNYHAKKELFSSLKKLHIVTPSNWLKNHVLNSFLKKYEVSVIHNGIDLSVFKPNTGVRKEKVILGVASTWDKRKGLEDFYALRSKLSFDWNIVLIGLSEKQIKQLPTGIHGLARTENIQELVKWYSKAFCFVNPTYQDNFPTTNIEALACGTPVITYDTGGSPEAIDEFTGCVVNQGNIDGILSGIRSLQLRNAIELFKACRDRAEKKFDKQKRYGDYLKIYQKLR